MAVHVLTLGQRATLEQILLGLTPPDDLPGVAGDVFTDEEGTPIARRDGDRLVSLRDLAWTPPPTHPITRPVVLAVPGQVPAGALPSGALLLLPAAGVRPDDTWYQRWAQAWVQAAAEVVRIPATTQDAEESLARVSSAYAPGASLTRVDTVPQPSGAGVAVMLTGLSGSGKSTIARELVERLAPTRSVTLLDGDVVRTHLSKGLGFSQADRDTNVRRIGWVAAEVAKHGGVAVCAPIAPYDATRRWVRQTVESAAGPGSFLLVWVSTPIEVCEQRDVKGLYAKARAGELTGFTGIDDPYEPPLDAELVIDTSQTALEEAVTQILAQVEAPTGG